MHYCLLSGCVIDILLSLQALLFTDLTFRCLHRSSLRTVDMSNVKVIVVVAGNGINLLGNSLYVAHRSRMYEIQDPKKKLQCVRLHTFKRGPSIDKAHYFKKPPLMIVSTDNP